MGGNNGGSGGGGCFGYTTLQNHYLFRQSTRLPVDRFLWTHHHSQIQFTHHHHQQVPNVMLQNNQIFTEISSSSSSSFLGEKSSNYSGTSFVNFGDDSSWPNNIQEISFSENRSFFVHAGENAVDVIQRVIGSAPAVEESPPERKVKCRSSGPKTKGSWTEEEDRNLIRLVKEHGVKKWTQLAENMVGRAGKQCRERWKNHLCPDIKKDNWSEEEEQILVEAHEELGNKWAEIAKRIPGRAENSVKNHWNATKRRQKSRRRNIKCQPTILQDYINTKYLMDSNSTSTSGAVTATVSEGSSIQTRHDYPLLLSTSTSDDDSPASLLIHQPCHDDDMSFMQSLFQKSISSNTTMAADDAKLHSHARGGGGEEDSCSFYFAAEPNLFTNEAERTSPQVNHYPPDRCLSYLVDESLNGGSKMEFMMKQECTSYSPFSSGAKAKDIDLMELIFSYHSSQGSNNKPNPSY